MTSTANKADTAHRVPGRFPLGGPIASAIGRAQRARGAMEVADQ